MGNNSDLGCQCQWLEQCPEAFYGEHDGRKYCVFHFPSEAKKEDFERALAMRFDESNDKYLNFVGVWFPNLVSFLGRNFTGLVDFSNARFNSDVEFPESQFDAVRFVGAHFKGQANFAETQYAGIADFSGARFEQPASFSRATFFNDGRYFQTQFANFADFSGAEFEGDTYFNLAVFDIADFGVVSIPVGGDKSKTTGNPQFETYRSKFRNVQF